jgi:hypothetical protein
MDCSLPSLNLLLLKFHGHLGSANGDVFGLMDSHTDWGTHLSMIGRFISSRRASFPSGTYIREKSTLLATFAEGGAAQTSHHLNTAQANVEYHSGTRFSGTAGLFNITRTSDPLLSPKLRFREAPTDLLNGYTLNASWWPAHGGAIHGLPAV